MKYYVTGMFEKASVPQEAVVEVKRGSSSDPHPIITVRVKHSRVTHTVLLKDVAERVVREGIITQATEEAPKRRRKLARRGLLRI